jgi:hypothetical protein
MTTITLITVTLYVFTCHSNLSLSLSLSLCCLPLVISSLYLARLLERPLAVTCYVEESWHSMLWTATRTVSTFLCRKQSHSNHCECCRPARTFRARAGNRKRLNWLFRPASHTSWRRARSDVSHCVDDLPPNKPTLCRRLFSLPCSTTSYRSL